MQLVDQISENWVYNWIKRIPPPQSLNSLDPYLLKVMADITAEPITLQNFSLVN